MRRVPVDRATRGPDDPRATLPKRGRPFEPGNPYRIQPSGQPRASRSTPYRPPAAFSGRPAYAPPQPRPAPAPASPRRASRVRRNGSLDIPAPQAYGLRPVQPYQPCGFCSEEQIRNRDGRYPAAVGQIQAWQGQQFRGRHWLCTQHFQKATADPAPGWKVYVTVQAVRAF